MKYLPDVLSQLMNWLDKPPPDVLVLVFNRWGDVAGEACAACSRPVAIEGNRLVIQADNTMYANQIRWNAETILDRIAELSGVKRLEELVVRVSYHTDTTRSSRSD